MNAVVVATGRDADAITRLRREQYAASPDFVLRDASYVDWGPADASGIVLAVRDASGRLVSTMAGALVSDPALIADHCGGAPMDAIAQWPAMLLRRAATAKDVRDAGLNSLLRFHLLRAASAWGIRFVVGSVVMGAARTRLMAEMGYTFVEEPRGWDAIGFTVPKRTAMGVLDVPTHGERALHVLATRVAPLIAEYPFAGELPTGESVKRWGGLTRADRALVDALVAVAWADGRFDEEERRALDGVLVALGATEDEAREIRARAAMPLTLDDIALDAITADDRRMLLGYASEFSYVDGAQAGEEHALLNELARRLAIGSDEAERIRTRARDRFLARERLVAPARP